MSTPREIIDTGSKALRINLDLRRYGSFAEIGAGQEVVRWFFRVGGAAGTVAKSMSAYDMTVSDAIYGKTDRYVSKNRLASMLEHEHRLNIERLGEQRGDTTAFFVFADTVAARSFRNTNDCHGWMGVKFQAHPRDQDSQIILHVRLLDPENSAQQEAMAIVGVNLLYGAFFLHHEPEALLESLLDGLTINRLEIDMIEFSGIEFRHVDNRLMSVKLVELGLSRAAMFGPDGSVLQPSEVLYKKDVLVERGGFRPVANLHLDMLSCARKAFDEDREHTGSKNEVAEIFEITMSSLRKDVGKVETKDFLARADLLCTIGRTVMISDFSEYWRLAQYLGRVTKGKIALTMGSPQLRDLLEEKYYQGLEGGILEAMGRLFKNDLHMYIYPVEHPDGTVDDAETFVPDKGLENLYSYLHGRGLFRTLKGYDPKLQGLSSTEVLKKLKGNEPGWEKFVPEQVAEIIKKRNLFGYRPGGDE